MSTIHILTRQGKIIKIRVLDSMGEIWSKINGEYEPNAIYNSNINREFIFLTDHRSKPLIFHKRYLFKITDDTTEKS